MKIVIIFSIVFIFLFLSSLGCTSPNNSTGYVENEFNEFNEKDFNKVIANSNKIFVVLFYRNDLDDNWYEHHLWPFVRYDEQLITGKLRYSNDNQFISCCDAYYVIIQNGDTIKTFNINTDFWEIKEVVDSILDIDLPDSCPQMTITWEKINSPLPFSFQNYSKALVLKNKLHVINVKTINESGDSLYSILSTNDFVSWEIVPTNGQIPLRIHILSVENDTVWCASLAEYFSMFYSNDTLLKSIHSEINNQQIKSISDNSIVKHNDSLFSIGGYFNGDFIGTWVAPIDTISSWNKIDDNEYRKQTITYFNDHFYLIGGYYRWEIQNYTLISSNLIGWFNESDIYSYGITFRSNTTTLHYKSDLLIIGGLNEDTTLNDMYITRTGIDWYKVNQLNLFTPVYDASAVYFNGKIWIIGGHNINDISNEIPVNSSSLDIDEIWSGTVVDEKL